MASAQPIGQAGRDELERVLSSTCFSRNERVSRLLRFLVEKQLEGRENELKESVIGVEVFGRRPDFNPKLDSTVRSEAVRLRALLDRYYSMEGSQDALVIELPKGGYIPTFRQCETASRRLRLATGFGKNHPAEPTMAPPGERCHNLPIQRTPLIGREKVLSAAKQLLLRQDVRLVSQQDHRLAISLRNRLLRT